ncbi:PAS domain S-box protein [Candidatus Peregrinibacteria bacterium]|nr:PAS domain S-box protein [Candidatus Peregrinibacteria bacterium]
MGKRDIHHIISRQLISKIQENFCSSLDISLTIYSANGENITRESRTTEFWKNFVFGNPAVYPKCKAAEINAINTCIAQKSIYIYRIYCDIVAFAVPIVINNEIIAVCVGGKVRSDNPNLKLCKAEAENIKADFDTFLEEYLAIPMVENEKLLSMANLLKHILETILELNISKKTSKEKIDEMEIMKDMLQKEVYSKTKNMYEVHQKYQSIVENAVDVILTLNKDGIITEMNRAIENNLWTTRDEVIGSHFSKFLPSENIPEIKKFINDFADKKMASVSGMLVPIYDLNENLHYFSVSAKPVYNSAGNLTEIQCIMHEITEQKKLEKELSEAKDDYSHLFESIEYGIYIADLNGNIMRANKSMYSLFGYTKEELNNIKIWNLYSKETEIKKCISRVIEEKGTTILNAVAEDKKGKEFYVELSVTAIKGETGKIIGHSGVVRDISNRIEYMVKAKSEEAKYKSLFENVHEGIIITNEKGEIANANPRASLMFKGKMKTGANIKDLIPEITDDRLKKISKKGETAIKFPDKKVFAVGIKIKFDGQTQYQWIFTEPCNIDYLRMQKSIEQGRPPKADTGVRTGRPPEAEAKNESR